MLPAPLDIRRPRALSTIYCPRHNRRSRKNRTAPTRIMLDELPIRNSISPFMPLPAIGQKKALNKETKLFIFDINKNNLRPSTVEERSVKVHDSLKPLTPLRVHAYDDIERKPQQLVRENTYDVIKPIFLQAPKFKRRDHSLSQRLSPMVGNAENSVRKKTPERSKVSAKTRFKKAALEIAKLSSVPQTGKLLCLREREILKMPEEIEDDYYKESPESPTQKLNKLSEIFQNLDMKGHHKVKKENSWF